MKKQLLVIAAFCYFSNGSFAQSFTPAFDRFSGKQVAYVYLEDGSKLEGTIDDLDRKKGLIEEITILPTGAKKKRKLEPKDIKTMYLPATGMERLGARMEQVTDVQKFASQNVNMEIINKGYAFFERVKVKVKRDTEDLLMQIVNPAFSSKIKVFHDPLAGESSGLNLGGMQLTGGDDKSYYVQVGTAVAEKIKKKEYDEEYLKLFKDCPALIQKLGSSHSWGDFDKHLLEYTTDCK